jgi:hypothetical protein
MKVLLAGTAMLLVTASAHAADVSLPKEYWGKWCASGSTTGGGSPRFWQYSRTDCSDPAKFLRDEDMTIGPHSRNGCRATNRIDWKEDNARVYFVTYRCKDGNKYTAKMWLEDGGLGAQYHWIGK